MAVPDPTLTRFGIEHSVDLSQLLPAESEALRWVLRCTDSLNADYARLPDHVLETESSVGFLRQLLARCAEMTEGAILAFATGSGSAAEVLARAAVERAVTFRFIIEDPAPRLAAYFHRHVDDVERQIKQWTLVASALSSEGRAIHLAACKQRSVANDRMRAFVEDLTHELIGSAPRQNWPSSIAERFDRLDDSVTYRTVYARLCAETHFDAEETLRYILGKLHGDDVLEHMSLETIEFTRLMLAISVTSYLRALGDYASRYELSATLQLCDQGIGAMERLSKELSKHVGAVDSTE